jgi:glutaredoxin 2
MRRTPEAQAAVDEATRDLALYQFRLCPFCIKVRRAIHRLNLHIELRDALNDPEHRAALLTGGGEIKVPCLAISADGETRWLYESSDIIDWLEHRFGETREARQAS